MKTGESTKNPSLSFKKKKNIFNSQEVYLLIIIIFVCVIVSIVSPNFFTGINLLNIFRQAVVTGIIALASAIILISGGIDLSVGLMMSFSAVVTVKLITIGLNPILSVCVGFLVATICGLFNGFLVSVTKCQPFIITLGMLSIYQGGALLVTRGVIVNVPATVNLPGSGSVGFFPITIIILLAVFLVAYFILNRTRFGRRLYAMGGNEEAAYCSGINVNLYKVFIYGIAGLLVGLASLMLIVRLGSSNALMGSGYELRGIAAAVIGGVNLSGGKGSIAGVFLGVFLLVIISNALNLLGVNPYFQTMVLGAIIVFAVIISNLAERRN